ncbi:hypothetical protein PG984_008013 [Apiospora sp. TS-2023a]
MSLTSGACGAGSSAGSSAFLGCDKDVFQGIPSRYCKLPVARYLAQFRGAAVGRWVVSARKTWHCSHSTTVTNTKNRQPEQQPGPPTLPPSLRHAAGNKVQEKGTQLPHGSMEARRRSSS